MSQRLWHFTDKLGSFEAAGIEESKTLYFPLCNETLLSCVTPTLHGDIKTGQNSFLLIPVSRMDLVNSRSSRNFWIYLVRNAKDSNRISKGGSPHKDKIWSATGVSKDYEQIQQDLVKLEAGLLWHKVTRENRRIGLRAEILSFVPSSGEPVEILTVRLTNSTSRKITFIPTAAIPLYARSAHNLRDHRHVTSLLQRIRLHKFGVIVKPTLVFEESGHRPNKTLYFVLGWDEKFKAPQYLYPTQEMFCQDGGDLEAPESALKNLLPAKQQIQGREAMGALRFAPVTLEPGESRSYILFMGITQDEAWIPRLIQKFKNSKQVEHAFENTKDFWRRKSDAISVLTAQSDFNNWFRWVSVQPYLRKVFGCSFLPDFDYGKGGRGWRDLWQDCLSLILSDPSQARSLLVNNFSGVRIDGSNATIIGKKDSKFFADRNNISRVWMDHGVWPLMTLDLYMNETGDLDILFEKTSYFRDHQICRCREVDPAWSPSSEKALKTHSGKIYRGTVLEHLLVQNLTSFFNVGAHNFIRLEGADWNDGLDMAKEKGESVAFSAMYAHHLKLLSDLLLKSGVRHIEVHKELAILLSEMNYNDAKGKLKVLERYFEKTRASVSGAKLRLEAFLLSDNLRRKSMWLANHIRKDAWLPQGFFNGYYDNAGKRVEGQKGRRARMSLSSQVFPIMSGVADDAQVEQILRSVIKYLQDKKCKGIRLNTDFKEEQHNLGRAFSFVYGDKENGAFFNHMIVMFAFALYSRGFVAKGWEALSSVYRMALDTQKSKIYPCLPEYFNLEGRGMYSYLTGSASWFVLTLLTQVFGVKAKDGDLLIEPKFLAVQFKETQVLRIRRNFCGRPLEVSFFNPRRLDYPKYKIIKVDLNSLPLPSPDASRMVIKRKIILNLPLKEINKLHIHLG
ncbi:MAG: cellobiose phosphorylase [Candidatus Omnitrophota bacterium]